LRINAQNEKRAEELRRAGPSFRSILRTLPGNSGPTSLTGRRNMIRKNGRREGFWLDSERWKKRLLRFGLFFSIWKGPAISIRKI